MSSLIPMEPLITDITLQTDPHLGLSTQEAQSRLVTYGLNALVEKKTNRWLRFLSYFGGAISFLLEIAALVSAILGDWIDFGILIFVLIVNACVGFIEESKAENALEALKNTLALHCKTWRDGKLVEIEAQYLVPGDVIALRLGDIVPADTKLLGLNSAGEPTEAHLLIDQSALTGESLPVDKSKDEIVFSSSIVKQGQMRGIVVKTGDKTYIGRAANLINVTVEAGHFQKIVNQIGNFLIFITVIFALILLFVNIFGKGKDFKAALKQVLIITIAAIPVGLPTVLSVTMAVGSNQLAKKKVVVKRLTAIEELASVSVLCSDKTGTLTLNQLTFDQPYLANRGSTPQNLKGTGDLYTESDLLLHAFFASEPGAQDAIEKAVRTAGQKRVPILANIREGTHDVPGYKITGFVPFNPTSKYTEATVFEESTSKKFRCIKGAPHVIVSMCGGHSEADDAVHDFAKRGLRALGVAKTVDDDMSTFELIGMISLLDPPRPDSKATIKACHALGLSIKMITGDQQVIAKEVAHRLGMDRTILDAQQLKDATLEDKALAHRVLRADGFAQVIPEHKYEVVEILQHQGIIVGMTGDGVNDAPALKKANVGIAVHGCTDAARSAADIVLLAPGLSTIVDGVKTSRAIFQRMRSYSSFNFSLPDRLIILIAVLNDAATLVISVDHAKIAKRPAKWRIGQLLVLSFVLGLLLMGLSFATYFVAKLVFRVTPQQLQTIMYLQISSAPHFVIFSTRLDSWFWESVPSLIFILSILGTQVFAMFMSVYGVAFFEAVPMYVFAAIQNDLISSGWDWGISIIACSLVYFMLLDVVKVMILRYWTFELTAFLWPTPARRRELKRRHDRKAIDDRIRHSIASVRKVTHTIWFIRAIKDGLSRESGKKKNDKRNDTIVVIGTM